MEISRRAAKRARHRDHVMAKAARDEDRHRKEAEKQRRLLEERRWEMREQKRLEEAVVRTDEVQQQMQRLAVVLRASLKHIPEELDFEGMKKDLPDDLRDLDLGIDAEPFPLPQWEEYAPSQPGGFGRLFNLGKATREARLEDAEEAYAHALQRYREEETARRERIEKIRADQLDANSDEQGTDEQRAIREHNKEIDDFRAHVFAGDRTAVNDYYLRVFKKVKDNLDLPKKRRFAYVPGSKLLLVEWRVPDFDVVPREREFRYNRGNDGIEVARWRSINVVRETYSNLMAQLALRGVAGAFSADPNWLVETVVFNAVVASTFDSDEHDEPVCVFSMRATRNQFEKLNLTDLTDTEPLEQVKKRFAARISPFPEELARITPILPYELAEPFEEMHRPDDHQPLDLNTMSTQELDRLLAQLLERMGYTVNVIRPEDDDCDVLATRQTPDGPDKIVVHLRRVARLAGIGDVRALMQAIRSERANGGMLLVTGGYDTRAFEYANGKPVQLYDEHTLLALLHQHGLATHEAGVVSLESETEAPDADAASAERSGSEAAETPETPAAEPPKSAFPRPRPRPRRTGIAVHVSR